MRHLITLDTWTAEQVTAVIKLAHNMKRNPGDCRDSVSQKTLVMIFEKPSLRTRVSFETGFWQMGGHAIYYDTSTSPMGAGKESIHDTIKVLSRYADIVMARVFEHKHLEEMVEHSAVPVINALSNYSHPCQILADLMTIEEYKQSLTGLKLAYLGDSNNNVTHSLMFGCALMGMHISVGCPAGAAYSPHLDVVQRTLELAKVNNTRVEVTHDAVEAVRGADVVYTDSWMSYHIPQEQLDQRVKIFKPFQVTGELMRQADKEAIFMNCLPAIRGYEQTAEVIDGPQSVVFDEAENRLHAQKALMLVLLQSVVS